MRSVSRLFVSIGMAALAVCGSAQAPLPLKPDSAAVLEHVDMAKLIAGNNPNLQGTLSLCLSWPVYRKFLTDMPQQKQVAPPIKAFDQLYYIGMRDVGSWVLVTSDGIIQFDALDNSEEAERIIVGGYKKLGLNPADMKYLVITHWHGDHSGGAKYLQDKYHPHVLMGGLDWDMLAKQPATRPDGTPTIPPPTRDMTVTDGQKLTLGKTTVTLYVTPGHTVATTSAVFPVTDHGTPHMVSFLGGTAFQQNMDSIKQSRESLKRFTKIGEDANVDVLISNHSWFDNTFIGADTDKGARIAKRKPGEPNPFVVGQSEFVRYMLVSLECEAADQQRLMDAAQ